MSSRKLTPLSASLRGLVAGAVGTGAMTAAQTAYYKATGSESSTTPGEVGKRIFEGVLQRDFPEDKMGAVNQGMHALYGTSWGVPFGIASGSSRASGSVVAKGLAFALVVWAAGRGEMTAMQLAPPPWQDPPSSLAVDVGSHLVYGLATAAAFRALR